MRENAKVSVGCSFCSRPEFFGTLAAFGYLDHDSGGTEKGYLDFFWANDFRDLRSFLCLDQDFRRFFLGGWVMILVTNLTWSLHDQ